MNCELYPGMEPKTKTTLIRFLLITLVSSPAFFLVACGGFDTAPSNPPTTIEESVAGQEVLNREFSECEGEEIPENPLNYVQHVPTAPTSRAAFAQRQQSAVAADFPHIYRSIDRSFPLRGSWRKSKAEIMDLVDRKIWSPDQAAAVPLLHYFDMVLMFNVASRNANTPENFSAQKVQVLARDGSSNDLATWKKLATWRISSGRPCGQKIETPTGVFKFDPQRAHEEYGSNEFRDENGEKIEMYETMFLQHSYQQEDSARERCPDGVCPTGVALHGTYVTEKLGRRDSGGCIRIYRDHMTCLFNTFAGRSPTKCLAGSLDSYWGTVPSILARNGEADPEYLRSGNIEMQGYRVLVVIFDDANDQL